MPTIHVHGIERRSGPQAYLRQLERARDNPLTFRRAGTALRKQHPRPPERTRAQQREVKERPPIEEFSHRCTPGWAAASLAEHCHAAHNPTLYMDS